MSPKREGILDSEYWEEEDIKESQPSKPLWKPSIPRTSPWLTYIRPSFFRNHSTVTKSALRKTAWLDGLRGFAALMVYFGHHQLWAHDAVQGADKIFENGFGYMKQYYFACFPGIRTFFSGGHYSVTVFFVISGYVLSNKPLQYIHSNDQLKLSENLASAFFRRWPRLHLPIIATTFLYMTSWHLFGWWTDAEHQSTYRGELWNWYAEFKNFSFVFRSGGENWFTYDFHVWSIPVEMRGSVIIYIALLAFSRLKKNARLLCEVGCVFYFLYIVDGWFGAMFMAGMLLCDLDLLADSNNLPGFFSMLDSFKELIFYNLFFISIFLGGVPNADADLDILRKSPGWYFLSYLKPQAVFDYKWFFLFWAATFLVASIPRIQWLKRFFETRFCQYLGRISFAFYLVHGPVLWLLADRLYAATGWVKPQHLVGIPKWVNWMPLPKGGPLGLEAAFWVPQLIILPFTLWCAEVVTRAFDEPSVRFSQWMYRKLLAANGAMK